MARSNRRIAKPATEATFEEVTLLPGAPADTAPASTELVVAETPAEPAVVEAEAPAAEAVVAEATPTVDPFADLPTITVDEFQFRDLSGVAPGANVFKYSGVATAAREARAQVMVGWKHSAAMLTLGNVRPELKAGTVYGDIQKIVGAHGRAGVPAYVVVARLRQMQVGNKRSKYCSELPPIGWAENWINTFVSKGYAKVMDKKAPSLTAEVAAELALPEVQPESIAA